MALALHRFFRPRRAASRVVAALAAFRHDRSGATAIEFGIVGMVLITVLLATIQFALLFLSQMSLHDALSDAATGSNAKTLSGDRSGVAQQVCDRLLLVDNCATKLLLEMAPLATYGTAYQAVSGKTFVTGASGNFMVIRAQAPIVSFVPGLPELFVRGAALYVRP